MRIPQAPESEITDEAVFLNRRDLLRLGTTAVIGSAVAGCPATDEAVARSAHTRDASTLPRLSDVQPAPPAYRVDEKITRESDATGYNNFYEFGTDKASPARLAHTLKTKPWSVAVEGAVGRPGIYALEDLLKPHTLEDRIYRLRCVEGWSMVIPWRGFPLRDLINRLEPTSRTEYVEFTTLNDPVQMPGV
ncbi:MAG: molybdopterin-dependent oxidoreductase [Planctomycetes bacterium]|nr:molybdopterin-dependent oxidoreductase [Planctomycetota bacterium]